MSLEKIPNPKVESYLWGSFKDELRALKLFLRYQWYLILILVIGLSLVADRLNPLPPSKLRIATGQPNSTLEVLGKKFQVRLEKNGIDVELVPSKGAADSLEFLKAGLVDVALSQGGLDTAQNSGRLSLGSIGYQPLWLFYTGPVFLGEDISDFLRGKRIYIGVPGSGTRIMVEALLKELGLDDWPEFSSEGEINASAGVDALLSKNLDAVFLVGGFESGNIQTLLEEPQVNIMNFKVAEALTRRLTYLELVRVPRGSVSLSPPRPQEDVNMAASTTTLLIRQDLHHSIQNLILSISKEIYANESYFFDRPGGFPAFVDKQTPRSPIAEKFYSRGPPLLTGYVPYWLASYIDLAWFNLTLIFFIYPILRLIPGYRRYVFKVFSSDLYGQIFNLEKVLVAATSEDGLRSLRERLVLLDKTIRNMWTPRGTKEAYTHLFNAHELLVRRANARFVKFQVPAIEL